MSGNVQLRWIAEAEARCVQEFALAERAASEPRLNLVQARAGPAWLDRLCELAPGLARQLVRRRRLPKAAGLVCKSGSTESVFYSRSAADGERVLVTVLFTDIVGSTKHAAEMGDRQWRALLDRHDDATRYQIGRFRGREIKNLGDGFLATFDSPARAVRCAAAIVETIAPLGIAVRSGLHTGEIDVQRDDISGIAVHIAARIAAMADPGEAFVSRTVRDLVSGSGLVFHDRGIHVLRGVPEQIHLYAIRPSDDA
jgi:class 3 adenylate cyclase